MSSQDIVLVSPDDTVLGYTDKISAHRFAMLHRAFSVFLYRSRNGVVEILLQQRQQDKYHCGGLWTNTCCSHPRPNETILSAGMRRLQEELGVTATLRELGQFHYIAVLDNGFYENELDHVLTGEYPEDIIPFNPAEVQAVQWITLTDLEKWLIEEPEIFTPWFAQAYRLFKGSLDKH